MYKQTICHAFKEEIVTAVRKYLELRYEGIVSVDLKSTLSTFLIIQHNDRAGEFLADWSDSDLPGPVGVEKIFDSRMLELISAALLEDRGFVRINLCEGSPRLYELRTPCTSVRILS